METHAPPPTRTPFQEAFGLNTKKKDFLLPGPLAKNYFPHLMHSGDFFSQFLSPESLFVEAVKRVSPVSSGAAGPMHLQTHAAPHSLVVERRPRGDG